MSEESKEKLNEKMQGDEEAMQMNCAEFEAAMDDLDRAGTPGMALREAALAHAEGCSRCAQWMTDAEALDFSLRQIALHDGSLRAPARVEAALLQELRQQKEAASTSRGRGQWRLAILATAAAVLLAMGISLRHFSAGGAAGEHTASGTALESNATANSGGGGPGVEVAQNIENDGQDATAFVPLPYATDPATLEDGTVVRVELTRSALATLGMPVTDSGSLDTIPADIMLSEDGVPQAIRLVSPAGGGQ